MSSIEAPQAWTWTAARELAASLTAADDLPDDRIAAEAGVNRTTLQRWRQHPAFQARVAQIVADYRAAVLQHGIAIRENRMAALDDRWRRLKGVIAARAEAMQDDDKDPFNLGGHRTAALASGFASGLVGLEWVTNPKGGFRPQFKVDAGLSAEMRNLEKQAAQEMGEWVERGSQEMSGKDGAPLRFTIKIDRTGESDGDEGDGPGAADTRA